MAGLQLADDVPSPAKRAKLSGEDASTVKQQREVRPTAAHSDKTGARPARPQKCADVAPPRLIPAVTHSRISKANPPFRQPIEVGSFSFDSRGQQQLDRSELRSPAGKSGMDLKVGYNHRQKLNQTPDLTNILTWVSHNWACFLPKLRGQRTLPRAQLVPAAAARQQRILQQTSESDQWVISSGSIFGIDKQT